MKEEYGIKPNGNLFFREEMAKLANFDEAISELDARINEQDVRINELEKQIEANGAKLEELNNKLEQLKNQMGLYEQDSDTLGVTPDVML